MFRRNFIATVITTLGAADRQTVTYRIKGFSCVTCAVGLDAMLLQQQGVVHARSSYPDATTTIEFKPSIITDNSLRKFIAEMGFTAQ